MDGRSYQSGQPLRRLRRHLPMNGEEFPEGDGRGDGDDLLIMSFDQLPSTLMHHPMVPATEGLLPNSKGAATISTTSVLAHVTAGGSALDEVQSSRAEALPELLVGRGHSRQPHRASTRGCGRLRICPQPDQAALQHHRTAVGRSGGLVQALAARVPLQYSERASTL